MAWDEPEGTRGLAGVEKPDAKEPRERSGWVPRDWMDVSGRMFSAADIAGCSPLATVTDAFDLLEVRAWNTRHYARGLALVFAQITAKLGLTVHARP